LWILLQPWIVIERDDGEKRNFFGSGSSFPFLLPSFPFPALGCLCPTLPLRSAADRFEQIAFWLDKPYYGPVPGDKQATSLVGAAVQSKL
jgi:hypothetical protein